MVGRFTDFAGNETNEPAYQFGNISILKAALNQRTNFFGNSFVIDMHIRTGFSGSPVWIYRTPGTVFGDGNALSTSWHYVKLLGMHWGQFPEKWEIINQHSSSGIMPQANLMANGNFIEGLSGMALAVPAWTILDLLEEANLKSMRSAAEKTVIANDSWVMPMGTTAGAYSFFDTKSTLARELGSGPINMLAGTSFG